MDSKKLWAIHNSENGHWIYVLASSFDNAKENWQNKTGGTEFDVSYPAGVANSLRNYGYYWYKL